MVTVLNPELSKELQTAIDKADVASFTKLMDEHNVHGASFLFASARKNAFPLINRALSGDFTNKNYAEKLEIARMLVDRGADPDMGAPYGLSALSNILHIHQFLGVRNRINHEVYLFTLLFASELVIRYNADLNLTWKSKSYMLDDMIYIYERYYEKRISDLEQVSLEIIEHMLKRGAKWSRHIDPKAFPELTGLLMGYRDNQSEANTPKLPNPSFDAMFDAETAALAWKAWNEKQSPAYEGLQAVRQLQYRAYHHANWGFDEDGVEAIAILTELFSALEKDKRKAALADVKKLSVPQKNLMDLKSDYDKELFYKNKEILPMKPVYDDALYQRLYEACLMN
ncbi:hypothetical protein HYN59_06125 [Flavobacterium album]|uniref:Uncharacterized protein n=1 Tax=Flavobacterium album TaxID=2175091 RepID=A0A2S1QWG4_9FLAO|nr:hypothetical protein [Flavobacterium album]AWH84723.1 hypothetical protein HYN59_06125 [Flavobacterium album]